MKFAKKIKALKDNGINLKVVDDDIASVNPKESGLFFYNYQSETFESKNDYLTAVRELEQELYKEA